MDRKRIWIMCLLLGTALLLTACNGRAASAPVSASATAAPAAPETADAANGLTLSDAAAVYAAPNTYADCAFENVFQIYFAAPDIDGMKTYYAAGLVRGEEGSGLTLLRFQNDAPEFAEGETVYLYGTVLGQGKVVSDDGTSTELLMLDVSSYERSVPDAGLFTHAGTWMPKSGSAAAVCGTLSVEVSSVEFKEDESVLTTKTVDTSVTAQTTYYTDIFIHQNGYYAWYPACNYWIMPGGMPGYDNVPFPALDVDAPMTMQFVPFDEQGRPVAQALQIEVSP